ncbi:copine-8 [Anabrus simplex]|uniref:copine-8 n=1 Tax=Anabrus simplex TaxID=316456 RepID=UPI0035A31167
MATFTPGSSTLPSTEVELTISCRNLEDRDVFSKSDPMCVTYLKTFQDLDWKEISRTETIYNTLNPDFATKIHLTYWFEEQQMLKFAVYDIDSSSPILDEHDFLGQCECTLGQIVAGSNLKLPLIGRRISKGVLIVSMEEVTVGRDEVTLQFCGRGLDRKDIFGLSDPFLEFYKVTEDGSFLLAHRTEPRKWTLNPVWKPFTILTRSLCGGDIHRTIKVLCQDWNRNGNHKLIGQFYVTLRELSAGPGQQTVFKCINPRKKERSQSYKHSGEIRLLQYKFTKVYSFIDYIKAGLDLNCVIAIDFTASNGNPSSPDSLHYISSVPNQYEQALTAVGEIIQDYDSDKLFPVLGFGARIPPDGQVSHEFHVSMNPDNPNCDGISGVLQAYKNCIRQVQLYGPTNFSPVISQVARTARDYQDGSKYFILLIITDGIITDMPQTTKAIVEASDLPLSIIIVGVGEADFALMDVLDADTIPLVYNGVKARDIVQFVPFRNFQKLHNINQAKAYLAKEVLMEIPDQIVSYMNSRNLKPRTPVNRRSNSLPPAYTEL